MFLFIAREDIKGEFHVMASALSKEMGMMESQLKRWKDTAHEAASIREKVQALETSLTMKVGSYSCIHHIFGSLDISFFYILWNYTHPFEANHYWLVIQTKEKKGLTDLCAQQMMEIKSLKSLVKFSRLTISVLLFNYFRSCKVFRQVSLGYYFIPLWALVSMGTLSSSYMMRRNPILLF